MNKRFAVLAISLCLTVNSWAIAQSSAPAKPEDPHVAECIRKLGSSSFAQRENARQELQAIGMPALEALRAARKSSDVETSRRIAELIRHFEEQLLTQQILAAKEIHLKLTDATVDQALAELTRLSGYAIQFQGDRIVFANKTFSLDTGKTTFWQALDQFCDQAGLLEKIDLPASPAQTLGGKGRFNRVLVNNTPQPAPSPIVLIQRVKEKPLTSYAGAVKSQLRISRDAKTKDVDLDFIISVEPRLLNGSLASRPVIDKAIDQEQRKLAAIPEEKRVEPSPGNDGPAQQGGFPVMLANGMPTTQRRAHIGIKVGDQAATHLKELAGKLTVQLDLANETIARIDKILQATGQSAVGANGGTLKVNAVRKIGDDIEVQISMENLTPNPFGANVFINGGNVVIRGNVMIQNMVIGPGGVRIGGGAGNSKDLPDLMDARGQKYQIASVSADGFQIVNGASSRSATIIYRPNPGQTGPSELVLFGLRTHTIAVPFRFQNVPLP